MENYRNRPSSKFVYGDAVFLSRCTHSEAYDWLKHKNSGFHPVAGHPITPPDSHVLEYILLRRNSSLIDLALAEYGRSGSVLARIYKRANASTRVVACGNASLFEGEVISKNFKDRKDILIPIWEIVRNGPLAELRAICENPNLTNDFYVDLVSSWENDPDTRVPDERRLSSDRFRLALSFLSENSRISTPYHESRDKFFWYPLVQRDYDRVCKKCWELANILPVDPTWAHILSKIYTQLYRPGNVFNDLEAVLDRWRSIDEREYSAKRNLREEIAVKFYEPDVAMLSSEDRAIRWAFYRTFDPESSDFQSIDWRECVLKDDLCEIPLSKNMKIWRSSTGRDILRYIISIQNIKDRNFSDQVSLGSFYEKLEEYQKTNPEWFDNDNEQAALGKNNSHNENIAFILEDFNERIQDLFNNNSEKERQIEQLIRKIESNYFIQESEYEKNLSNLIIYFNNFINEQEVVREEMREFIIRSEGRRSPDALRVFYGALFGAIIGGVLLSIFFYY